MNAQMYRSTDRGSEGSENGSRNDAQEDDEGSEHISCSVKQQEK